VIANSQGNRITPSVVAFTKEGRIVGDGAEVQRKLNPPSVIYNAKRFIGKMWNDPIVQENATRYPFKILQKNGRVQFEADCDSKTFYQTPEEVAAAVLSRMKKIAEDYLEESVEDVVITVPAYFTDSQRQATKDAGKIAGLNVIRIINEPTAAAMAYGLREGEKEFEGRHVLVYDIGGGTFDVSVLEVENDLILVEATAGNTNLGGEDFTERIVRHFKMEIFRKHCVDITPDHKAMARLMGACEKLKRNLSAENVTESKIHIDAFLPDGSDFDSTMSRAKFEDICQILFKNTIQEVEKVLEDAKLAKEDIHEVVLVGGSSRIPKLQALLSAFFNINNNSSSNHKIILNKSINPDEAVACGAAIQAAILNNDQDASVKDLLLMDVNPLSIGFNVKGGITQFVIERNTVLPVKKPYVAVTGEDNQTNFCIKITEGERAMTKDNMILGFFDITDLPLRKAGEAKVDLEFALDANGILKVSATVRDTGKKAGITMDTSSSGRRSAEEINELIEKAEMMKTADEAQENRALTLNKLTALCHHIKLESQEYPETELGDLLTRTQDCIAWVSEHPDANEEPLLLRYEDLKYKASKLLIPSVSKEPTQRSDHVLRLDKLTSTFCLKKGRELMKTDQIKAAEWFQKAYQIAREMGRLDKTIEALQLLGHAHRILIKSSSNSSMVFQRINRAISTVSTLTSALDLDKNVHENEARKCVIQDIQFAVDEFFEMMKGLDYDVKSSILKRFMRAMENSSSIKNAEWLQIAFQCRIKEIQHVLEKVKDCIEKENYKVAQSVIKDLNYPKEQAKHCVRSGQEEDELNEMIDVIQMHSSHAEALNQLDLAEELLEGVREDDPDAIDKALLALDHLSHSKLLTKEKYKKVYVKASFFEGKIFMDLILNKEKAKACFHEVMELSDTNDNTDQLKETEFLLEKLQAEIERAKGRNLNKQNLRQELEMDINKLKAADSRMTDEEFCSFVFSEFPPKHKDGFKKPEMTANPMSKKRAYIRFLTFYHPDKVDSSEHGEKYKIRCDEISQCINGRFSKM